MTTAATGVSRAKSDKAAATEAMRAARSRLGEDISYAFVFASPEREFGAVQAAATEAANGAPVIGCTTAGELTELGPTTESVTVLAISSSTSTANMLFTDGLSLDADRAVRRLCQDAFDPRKSTRHRRHAITVMLTDGLSGAGEKLVQAVHDKLGGTIVGGAAADGGAFKGTYVGAGPKSSKDSVAALHISDAHPWGVGVDHGLRPTTKPMRVTQAADNIVSQIDGEAAFEVYKRHAAARGITLQTEGAAAYMIANELGIHFFDKIVRARAPLSVRPDGSLVCAAAVPKGSMVSILDGEPASMIQAARSAAQEAKDRLEGREPAAVLLFDCICRGMILKDALAREVDAVRDVFGDVPIAGFLTYGEIARYVGKLDGWHNATAVVAAIPK
jgi:hypothetical protein